ncbi:MAG: flavodoxin family protein [Bacilli bacterium]|nr:flavodoxin family protein [Bacilli bacterium]
MRTIIHDLNDKDLKNISFNTDDKILSSNCCNNNCIGCFSCWIKHPKRCIFNDEFFSMCDYLKDSSELIIISKNRYGCYSHSVKKVLERSIGYVLPYFTIRNGEVHHESRYDEKLKLSIYIYGEVSKEDKMCLERLVKANAINLNAQSYNVKYISKLKEINKCIL